MVDNGGPYRVVQMKLLSVKPLGCVLCLLFTAHRTLAQIPCDDAYGEFCPEESGFSVGECLKKHPLEKLGEPCLKYIQMHDHCRDDIDKHCSGKEYTGDALVCLSEWTKPEDLSAECLEMIPKREEKKKKELSAEEKKKAAKRRKARKAAEKMARKDL